MFCRRGYVLPPSGGKTYGDVFLIHNIHALEKVVSKKAFISSIFSWDNLVFAVHFLALTKKMRYNKGILVENTFFYGDSTEKNE